MVKYIGEPLVEKIDSLHQVAGTGIATLFPMLNVIVTTPGVHVMQRMEYTRRMSVERVSRGERALSSQEEMEIWLSAVDLLTQGNSILIRPDAVKLDLAFWADEILQTLLPKRQIRFLFWDPQIRDAIYKRGEAWRIQALPSSPEQVDHLIMSSLVAIKGRAIYRYSALTGTRVLTYEKFISLEGMEDDDLRRHLAEIQSLAGRLNGRRSPELALFMTPDMDIKNLLPPGISEMPMSMMRLAYQEACRLYEKATDVRFRVDDPTNGQWRTKMYRVLIDQADSLVKDEDLLGLGNQYNMNVRWLPGARILEEQVICDASNSDEPQVDAIVHELICNFTREYRDIEYINIGQVVRSMSRRVAIEGRRDVFVVQFKTRKAEIPELQIVRFLRWGIRERLDEGKPLLQAILDNEEYCSYILDRRLACGQLGMKLIPRVWTQRIQEIYRGKNWSMHGTTIWSPYVQREYVHGMSTDRVPKGMLGDLKFSRQLATILGKAAATNIIVGRAVKEGEIVFDDGDEVVVQDESGQIRDFLVTDLTCSFTNYDTDLSKDAPGYARPVQDRAPFVPDVGEFTRCYLEAFVTRFQTIQKRYRDRRGSFEDLFRYRYRNPEGNLAFRWVKVLERLDKTDPVALAQIIREHI